MSIFYRYSLWIRKKVHLLVLMVTIPILSSCGIWDPAPVSEVSTNVEERARKAMEEGKGISIGNVGGGGGTNFEFATSNIMWRATLEILDFLPLANVDYSGGIVSTDWYNEGTANNESIKITIRFLSNEIRADGIKVIVHKKVCTKQQNCMIKKVTSVLEQELKLAILKKATLLEKDIRKTNVKEYRKKYGKKKIRDKKY